MPRQMVYTVAYMVEMAALRASLNIPPLGKGNTCGEAELEEMHAAGSKCRGLSNKRRGSVLEESRHRPQSSGGTSMFDDLSKR